MCNAVSDSPCSINSFLTPDLSRVAFTRPCRQNAGPCDSLQQVREAFSDAYGKASFVQLVDGTPRLKNVVASNYCHIGVAVEGDTVVVMSAAGYLIKGAAGGAVQWMNRLWELSDQRPAGACAGVDLMLAATDP